jgi:general secretion pathway protein A
MYTAFFHLKQAPFSIAPDPNYLFMSERHREALAHLLYGVGSGGGFVLLTGEIGAGKTTVCRCFLEQVPQGCKVAYIFNPKLSVEELLQSICDEFGIAADAGQSLKAHVDALNAYLLATHGAGQNNVLIIDEAQNLSPQVLEQLRLLTNLETNQRKLLQIILIGQPELRTMLNRPELEQLAQRVIARYHLGPLSSQETGRYIAHRLAVAGLPHSALFGAGLMHLITRLTGGVPRRINLLCDRALLGSYARSKNHVERRVIIQAAREVFGTEDRRRPGRWWRVWQAWQMWMALVLAALIVVFALGWYGGMRKGPLPTGAPVAAQGAHKAALASTPATAAASGGALASARASTSAQAASAAPEALATAPVQRGEQANAAFAELAQLWGKSLPGPDPCQHAPKKNLRCYSGSGGWDEVRELRRPALLALQDAQRGAYYGLLLGLQDERVSLRVDGVTRSVGIDQLKDQFNGEFTTLWAMPRRFRDEVLQGDRGSDVDWIALQLANLQHLPKPRENAQFDTDLSRQVRQFQGVRKIKVDGLVGPKTFMHLNQATGVSEPRLAENVPPLATVPAAPAPASAATAATASPATAPVRK